MDSKMLGLVFSLSLGVVAQAAPLQGTGGAPGALPGGTVETFDSAPSGRNGSVTLNGITYAAAGGSFFTIDGSFTGSFNTSGQSLFNSRDADSFTRLDFSFGPMLLSAFAFNFGASDSVWVLSAFNAANMLIEALDIPAQRFNNAGNYFGIAAPGIASVSLRLVTCTIDCPIDFVFVDDFTYRTTTAVPEPATLTLFGAGLVALGALRRRR